jgi:thiamine-phosphate pyrophosphorylase
MRLVIISSPELVQDELQKVNSLFEQGLEYFHLRKPGLSIDAHRDYLKGIKPSFLKRIIVHDHFGLLNKYNLRGIHLNSRLYENADPEFFKEAKRKNIQIGTSVHSFEEVGKLKHVDYYFISPVFESISKIGYKGTVILEEYAQFLNEREKSGIKKPMAIALGGIDEENVGQLKPIGFDGAALLGAIWSKGMGVEEILEKFKKIKTIVNQS